MVEYLDKLIDERNVNIWKEVNNRFSIRLKESSEPNYLTNYKTDKITIHVDINDLNVASFTHELLHILLKARNIDIGKDFDNKTYDYSELIILLSKDLRDHISNSLEHVKILPLFTELGFKNHDFISDFDKNKMTNKEWRLLKNNYKIHNELNREAVDLFIGKFFAMKACNNPRFNYTDDYIKLKKLDDKLFTALNEFWADWMTFDINDPNDSYGEILDLLFDDLNNWTKNKNFH